MNTLKGVFLIIRKNIARLFRFLPCSSLVIGSPRNIIDSTLCHVEISSSFHTAFTFIPLRAKRSINRCPPQYADPLIADLFNQMGTGFIKEQFVAQLERGRYWGRSAGYIINSDDSLHRDLSPSFEDVTFDTPYLMPHDGMLQPLLPKLVNFSGVVASLNTLFSSNFHHWLLDCVPKFGLLKDAAYKLDNIDHFILTAPVSPWHLEVIHYLHLPLAKIISSSPSLHIRADYLIVPSFSEPSRQPHKFNYTPEGLNFVRNLVLDRVVPSPTYPEKIIVSRERATCRRLLSANHINLALEAEGFVKVILEDFTLAEQAAIFFSAKTIIMPTGGGLANIVFCQQGTKVIELFSPGYMPTFSFVLASQLGLQYTALVGENLTRSSGHSDSGASQDIYVPLDRLMAHI
jgi:Glycosyltransferase 61